ncbi:MAG: hypothetical protein NC133_03150, partial [Prevotella sp.]|nr:hypothetical protein [Prevotella sp.]
ADDALGQQIFDQARNILQNQDVETPSYTKKMYFDCLRANQFNAYYQYVQDLNARVGLVGSTE